MSLLQINSTSTKLFCLLMSLVSNRWSGEGPGTSFMPLVHIVANLRSGVFLPFLFGRRGNSLRSRRLEVVGERENGRVRGRQACLLLARPFLLVPTTSKRQLRRLARKKSLIAGYVVADLECLSKGKAKLVPFIGNPSLLLKKTLGESELLDIYKLTYEKKS